VAILTITDEIAPVAVCDEITTVSLSTDGLADVFAATFDDGSNDNCGIELMEVRRMSGGVFGPSVTFECADVATSPHMVVFRVTDYAGNTNECMVEVIVEDKLAPIVTTCPANQTLTCDFYLDNLSAAVNAGEYEGLEAYGLASFYDNCNLNVEYSVAVDINTCSEGTITRTWTATDDNPDNTAVTCTQVITVEHNNDWEVLFPADIEANCTAGTLPDFGEPTIFNDACELIGASYEDQLFTVVPDACYKIVRTWEVINWCTFDDYGSDSVVDPQVAPRRFAAGADGFVTYQQVIKVIDNEAPTFTLPTIDGCIVSGACTKDIILPMPTNVDECSDEFEVDIDGDFGTYNDVQGQVTIDDVAPGDYTVYYSVTDECGNFTSEAITVNVTDCKKPTPYCVNGVVIEIMQTGMIDIWASDLDAGSFDNCTGEDDLLVYFNNNPALTSLTFDCSQLGEQTVELWVEDEAGNKDFCETTIFVQDNMFACGDIAIAGTIATEEDETVENTEVTMNGTTVNQSITATDGAFNFGNAQQGGDYTVTPYNDSDPINGVTTYDLVLITKHILQLELLDSPYKMIAADANNSGSITTYDMVILRKLILMIDTEFANNTSWRFVDSDYVFPQPANPWAEEFPEVISYNNIAQSQLATDFVAVKIGDVNGSVQANINSAGEEREREAIEVKAADQDLRTGDVHTIEIKASDFEAIEGCQFTLNYGEELYLDMERLVLENSLIQANNIGLAKLDDGAITISWNKSDFEEMIEDNEELATEAEEILLLSLSFEALEDVTLSEAISINSRFTPAAAYDTDGNHLDIDLTWDSEVLAAFELYQNEPNPTTSMTKIGFNLPQADQAILTIRDVNGKLINEMKGNFKAGYNSFIVELNEPNGVLYYTIKTSTASATKSMIVAK